MPVIDVGTNRHIIKMDSSYYHACAILDNGTVKCWGRGTGGALGSGSTANIGDQADEMGDNLATVDLGTNRTAVDIDVGIYTSCAILDNDDLKCWGDGPRSGYGQTADIGDGANEMGDNLAAVNLGVNRTVSKLEVGYGHTCVILDNNDLKCWGDQSNYGELGLGNTNYYGDSASESFDNLPVIDLGTGVYATDVTTGESHTCAILNNGKVKCWGWDWAVQNGQGTKGDQANEMGNNLPYIDLGTNRTATHISSGEFHNCVILDNGDFKCWGVDVGGVEAPFGNESTGSVVSPAVTTVTNLGTNRTITKYISKYWSTCALLDDSQVKCWGDTSNSGNFHTGSTGDIGETAGDMGDNLPYLDF